MLVEKEYSFIFPRPSGDKVEKISQRLLRLQLERVQFYSYPFQGVLETEFSNNFIFNFMNTLSQVVEKNCPCISTGEIHSNDSKLVGSDLT